MSRNYIFVLVLFFSFAFGYCDGYGQNLGVSLKDAKKIAENYFFQENLSLRNIGESSINSFYPVIRNNDTLILVFNMNPEGFVVISGKKSIDPIIGFSTKGNFAFGTLNENMGSYFNQIIDILEHSKQNKTSSKEWEMLLIDNYERSTERSRTVSKVDPLLKDIEWGQGKYYNAACPKDAKNINTVYDGHVPVGCAAVAFGQILAYWKFPDSGEGNANYNLGQYGRGVLDFNSQKYTWNNLPNKLASHNQDISKLLFHLGIGVKMKYATDISTATLSNVERALKENFKYSQHVKQISRSQYKNNLNGFYDIIIKELEEGRPVYYSGHKNGTIGHGWVLDGYHTNLFGTKFFHMNWGWDGEKNGYYKLTDDYIDWKTPITFINENIILTEIQPRTLPVSGISVSKGSYTDKVLIKWQNQSKAHYGPYFQVWRSKEPDISKSAAVSQWLNKQYQYEDHSAIANEKYYYWVAAAQSILWDHDKQSFVGYNISKSVKEDNGFRAGTPTTCGLKTLTLSAATFDDGSPGYNYSDNMNCSWLIKPTNAKFINLKFSTFSTEYKKDQVKIFKGTSNSAPLIGVYSGSVLPPDINIETNAIFIEFVTDGAFNKIGWSASYTSDTKPISGDNFDEPCGAIDLPLLSFERYTWSDNTKATTTKNPPPDWFCDQYPYKDVWFRINIPARQKYSIKLTKGTLTDAVVMLYTSDDCLKFATDNLCQDDQPNGDLMPNMKVVSLIDYPKDRYIRVFGAENLTGTFGICVLDGGKNIVEDDMVQTRNNNSDMIIETNNLNENNLEIYPNPTINQFTVMDMNNKSSEITILNSTGMTMAQFTLHKSSIVDCSDWPSGMYFVKTLNNSSIKTFKIFVE